MPQSSGTAAFASVQCGWSLLGNCPGGFVCFPIIKENAMICRISTRIVLLAAVAVSLGGRAAAAPITLEPDDYAPGTVLNNVIPEVSLFASVNAGDLTGNFGFNVTSEVDGLASTGTQVFAHAGIPFFNSSRNLRLTFTDPVSVVSLDFIPSSDFFNENAIFTIFDENGIQLDQLIAPGLGGGVPQTLTFARSQSDIKYAVATSQGPFLRLDNLSFEVSQEAVPEPPSAGIWCLLALLAGGGLWLVRPGVKADGLRTAR
jgi:hypothetical protein